MRPEGPSDAPVLTCQQLDEALPPGLEHGLLELHWRVCPVDFLDHHQVAGIDVHTFGPTQVRQITPFDVRLKPMARDLCDAFDVVESPAPTLVRMEAQVVQASVNRVRASMQVAREFEETRAPFPIDLPRVERPRVRSARTAQYGRHDAQEYAEARPSGLKD